MYMSAEIQNELIDICGSIIKGQILCRVIEEKKFYSIDACDEKSIRLFFGTVRTVVKFINASPKRQNMLKKAIEATTWDTRRRKLTKLVEHRWVEKHTSVLVFKQLYPGVIAVLEHLTENGDAETSANSRAYLKAIKDLDFIVSLFVISRVFAITKPYTETLQNKSCDLTQCYENIQNVALHLAELKYDQTKLDELAKELENFSSDNDIKFTISRRNKHKNVADYLKHIYETFIQVTLTELGNRFSKHQKIVVNIMHLVPSNVVEKTFSGVKQVFDFYENDLPSSGIDIITAEFELWQHKWRKTRAEERPSNVTETLNVLATIHSFYPNLNRLFELFAILPVTVATAKRSFSTMK
ncbi:unnamed protein product, partial [Didymodactylos carnosus]